MKRRLLIPIVLTLLATVGFFPGIVTAVPTLSQVTKQQLSDDDEGLQRANAYIKQGNLDGAIASLEGLVRDGSKTAAVYQKLGELYLQAGRQTWLAEAAYTKAIALKAAAKDFKGQAEAQVALAKVKLMLGKPDEAKSLLTQSKAFYASLGDSQRTRELQRQITAANNANNARNLQGPVLRGRTVGSIACKAIKSKKIIIAQIPDICSFLPCAIPPSCDNSN